MPRQMSPERDEELTELTAFFEFYCLEVKARDPSDPINPINVLKDNIRVGARSLALRGLKHAINDTVEELSDQPSEYVQRLDAALSQRGIITFSEIRRRYSSNYARILKRGAIRNETEYYLIAGVLADSASRVSEAERVVLGKSIAVFEQRIKAKRKKA